MNHTIVITEEQRQSLLMALAHLAVERPGWHPAFLKRIAELMDNPEDSDSMYERFRELYHRDVREACLVESHRLLAHYSELLNQHDGGERVIPEKLEDWIARVRETKEGS